jgi:hypothetical protein
VHISVCDGSDSGQSGGYIPVRRMPATVVTPSHQPESASADRREMISSGSSSISFSDRGVYLYGSEVWFCDQSK